MQKGRNVIKLTVYMILISSAIGVSAQQKLNGKYSTTDGTGYFYKYYLFDDQGIFYFEEGGDLGASSVGKGYYQIKNDSLYLNYDLTELRDESYFKAKKYFNTKDSIEVRFNIYSFDSQPLDNIQVYAFPDMLSSDNIQSTASDQKGYAVLKFEKGAYKRKIEVYIDGEFWSRQIFYLDADTNYNIDAFMSKSVIIGFSHPTAIKYETKAYEIVELTEKYIKLKIEGHLFIFKKKE